MNVGVLLCRESESTDGAKLLNLKPEQWNQLMTVRPDGTNLYQEVVFPFKENPSVTIETENFNYTLKITGVPKAVSSAHEHIQLHLYKDLHVTER